MVGFIQTELGQIGCRCRVVPFSRVEDLRRSLARFAEAEALNGFQRFIVEKLYRYEESDIGFIPASVVIAAAPSPAYANVEFTHRGRTIATRCLHPARIAGEAAPDVLLGILQAALAPRGFHFAPAPSLPFKRLGAMSGLSSYGRNNITYVDGLGSFFNYAAYFTDAPCGEHEWDAPRMAERCESCRACAAACPTGAIRSDRFLIDCERCLSFFNEGPGEFPAWIPPDAHHTVYDCLRCQLACPMNRDFIGNVEGPFVFDEAETGMLLNGAKRTDFSQESQAKIARLGIDKWGGGVPRNLRVLFERHA